MSETPPNGATSLADQVRELTGEASQDLADRAKIRAEREAATPSVTRERVSLGALIVSLPILVLVVLTIGQGRSLLDLITPAPPPAVARQQAQQILDSVVKDIEGFRNDYSELPGSLAEVGVPTDCKATYTKKSGGQYQVVISVHGQVVTFESPHGGVTSRE